MIKGTITIVVAFTLVIVSSLVITAVMSYTVYVPKIEPLVKRDFKLRGTLYSDIGYPINQAFFATCLNSKIITTNRLPF